MTAYIIGREPDPTVPRIVLEDKTVSRKHASLSAIGDGKFILEDMGSSNGTFVREKGGWRRIDSVTVAAADEVRLGVFITTIESLLKRVVLAANRVRIERDPETGEIVKRLDER